MASTPCGTSWEFPMRLDQDPRLISALQKAMDAEAEQVQPSPGAWDRLQERLVAERLRPVRTRWKTGWPVALAGVSVALVVVALVLLTLGGPQRAAVPADTVSAFPSPVSTAPSGRYRPSQPRVAWTIYRPGTDGLLVDAARASAPYDPVQAVESLFEQAPTVPGAVSFPRNGANRVKSLTYLDGTVHLDMASVDDQTRPRGPGADAQARLWVESWVRTADEAFDSFGPVVITLNGSPTTLYGSVDTTQPLFDPRVEIAYTGSIFFPGPSERVTSPVGIAAMPGAVGDQLVVTGRDGRTVASLKADAAGGGRTVLSSAPELDPGDYTLTLRSRSGQVQEQRSFTVTGSAPSGARSPVTDPPTTPVATTLVYFPGPKDTLLAEPRPKTTLLEAVAAVGREPSSNDASWPFGSLTLSSVAEQDGAVLVDYAGDDKIRPTDPDAAKAAFWAQSLVHTVSAYVGRPVPVQVTLRGKSFLLFDALDSTEPIPFRPLDERLTDGLTLPDAVPAPGPLQVVGALDQRRDDVTWYVIDTITEETLYQGTAPVAADHSYGFSLVLPPGTYKIRVDAARRGAAPAQTATAGFEIV
ncbi:hypothetical protein [Microlunatus sagamiharensis]|uniref:hypothetical protein n=1 Tax=Microlunatus sagamiharensis TaxID=546874 RepID=UPI0015618266|nr:hypothetical protein [Microlunatus sagamiharensis]